MEKRIFAFVQVMLFVVLVLGMGVCGMPNVMAAESETETPRVVEQYGKLPLSFEANQGQTDKVVKFLSRGSGYGLYLTPTETVLTLRSRQTTTMHL
jgi:hypothetical protein